MSIRKPEQPLAKTDVVTDPPAVRCGAKTRKGTPCKNPPVTGKRRCRMHGGAPGSGAPLGNRNALKHGYYTAEAIEARKEARRILDESWDFLEKLLEAS